MLPWAHAPLIKGIICIFIYTTPTMLVRKHVAGRRNIIYSETVAIVPLPTELSSARSCLLFTPRMFPSRRMNWNCSKAKSRRGNLNSLLGWSWFRANGAWLKTHELMYICLYLYMIFVVSIFTYINTFVCAAFLNNVYLKPFDEPCVNWSLDLSFKSETASKYFVLRRFWGIGSAWGVPLSFAMETCLT